MLLIPSSFCIPMHSSQRAPCDCLLINLAEYIHIGSLNAYQCWRDYMLHYVSNSFPLWFANVWMFIPRTLVHVQLVRFSQRLNSSSLLFEVVLALLLR